MLTIIACEDPDKQTLTYNMAMIDDAFESAEQIADLRSLVVAQNKLIVKEDYYRGATNSASATFDVRSVTKSITATLIGIAIDHGFIDNVEQTIGELLTVYPYTIPPAVRAVTLHQLLCMSSGMDWREIGVTSEFGTWVNSPDQLEYALNKPFGPQPGTAFLYSDGGAHIVGAILESATNMQPADFALEYLFTPLGIGTRNWLEDNQGHNFGGVGLCIGPADMLKIGQLYLNNGKFDGEQVVSKSWVNAATAPHHHWQSPALLNRLRLFLVAGQRP